MIQNDIQNFAQQFSWEPKIENGPLPKFQRAVVVGMGGSHLAGDLLLARDPGLAITIHSDYGLPATADQETLVVASSYSGNTAETIDAFQEAIKRPIPVAALTTGGQLLELARAQAVPFIRMPLNGLQPRMALGYSTKSLARLLGQEQLVAELTTVSQTLKPAELEAPGKSLAHRLAGRVPVIYSSTRNYAIAYNWKIKLNETGKIPAFYNLIPELNHNEMTGFDVAESTRDLSSSFYFLMLRDDEDDQRIQKRMIILQKLYAERGLTVETLEISGANRWSRILNSLVLADWVAMSVAARYGVEAEQVPMVEEFKKLISE